MKITLSKSQWQEIGNKTGWNKTSQVDYPYSLLDTIKMQENGLSLKTMSFDELEEAKSLEKNGFINKVVKQDKQGKYYAYVVNEEKFKQMGWKTKFSKYQPENKSGFQKSSQQQDPLPNTASPPLPPLQPGDVIDFPFPSSLNQYKVFIIEQIEGNNIIGKYQPNSPKSFSKPIPNNIKKIGRIITSWNELLNLPNNTKLFLPFYRDSGLFIVNRNQNNQVYLSCPQDHNRQFPPYDEKYTKMNFNSQFFVKV